jgi:hypothetical protein
MQRFSICVFKTAQNSSNRHLVLAAASFEQKALIVQTLDKLGKVVELQRQLLRDRIQLEGRHTKGTRGQKLQ